MSVYQISWCVGKHSSLECGFSFLSLKYSPGFCVPEKHLSLLLPSVYISTGTLFCYSPASLAGLLTPHQQTTELPVLAGGSGSEPTTLYF